MLVEGDDTSLLAHALLYLHKLVGDNLAQFEGGVCFAQAAVCQQTVQARGVLTDGLLEEVACVGLAVAAEFFVYDVVALGQELGRNLLAVVL